MKKYKMPNMGKLTGVQRVGSIRNPYGFNANHKIINFEKWQVLTSYESVIVVIKEGQVYLWNDHDYSRTTAMYRNNFLWVESKEFHKNYENWVYKLINI